MQNDVEGRRRDDEMRQRHEQAVAAGEKRVLSRTMEGRLYSYSTLR